MAFHRRGSGWCAPVRRCCQILASTTSTFGYWRARTAREPWWVVARCPSSSPALATFTEKDLGSLEPGKLADFTVVDRDLLTVGEDQLPKARVVATFINGEEVAQGR